MRILVTGDKGYIGTVMVPLLIQEGYTVTGLDSDWFEQSAFSELPVKVVSRKKDLRDLEPSDLEGFDAVIHLAGLSNDPLGDLNPSLTMTSTTQPPCDWQTWPRNPAFPAFRFLLPPPPTLPQAPTNS